MADRSSPPSSSTAAHLIQKPPPTVCKDRSHDGKRASTLRSLRTPSRASQSPEEPPISAVSFTAAPSGSKLVLPGQSIWKSTDATPGRKQRQFRHSFVFFRAAHQRKRNSRHPKTASNSGS